MKKSQTVQSNQHFFIAFVCHIVKKLWSKFRVNMFRFEDEIAFGDVRIDNISYLFKMVSFLNMVPSDFFLTVLDLPVYQISHVYV